MKTTIGWNLALVALIGLGACDGDAESAAGGDAAGTQDTAGDAADDTGGTGGDVAGDDTGGLDDTGGGDVAGDDTGGLDDTGGGDVAGDDTGGLDDTGGPDDVAQTDDTGGQDDTGTGDIAGTDTSGDDIGTEDTAGEDIAGPDELYVVVVRGRLLESDPEAAQQAHDAVALGGKETALALGDIAHTAFVSMEDPQEFLAVDVWTSFEGMQGFLTDPNVQAAFGSLFEAPPQANVWIPQAGWAVWGELTDLGVDDQRWLVTIEATLKGADAAEAGAMHDAVAMGGKEAATAAGDVAHLPHLAADGTLSFLAMDIWLNAEGMQGFLGNPDVQAAFGSIFTGPPTVGVWAATGWAHW